MISKKFRAIFDVEAGAEIKQILIHKCYHDLEIKTIKLKGSVNIAGQLLFLKFYFGLFSVLFAELHYKKSILETTIYQIVIKFT